MPDTLIPTESFSSQPAPTKRCAKKRPPVSGSFRPAEFVKRVIDAIKPTLGKEGEIESTPHSAKALVALFGGYTVEDAVYALGLLRVAINAANDECESGEDTSDASALCSAAMILEDFCTYAKASSASCVTARAHLMELAAQDDAWALPNESAVARSTLNDTKELRAGKFSGATFGYCLPTAGFPWWLYDAAERRDGQSPGDELREVFSGSSQEAA